MLKNVTRLWGAALAVAWAFDFLFWGKIPGISFALFVILCVAGGLFLAWREGVRPARLSLLLLIPIAFFAGVSFMRLEPFTLLVSYGLALAMMALLAQTFFGGRWMAYSLADHVRGYIALAWSAASRGATVAARRASEVHSVSEAQAAPEARSNTVQAWRRALPALRGLALALPVVAVFSALLASADPIFSRSLEDFLSLFRLEKLPEYLFRLALILFLAYVLVGVYLHALTNSRDERLLGLEKPLVAPFFGLTEAVMILGSVNLLFAFFVGIQFRYFFGGQANIHLEGFTYSEYARRGFGELVVVAFFSLLLFLGLSAFARRETPLQRRLFSALGLLLVALVAIILVSAFQRLMLYEQAYGFSRLRAYTHVFMFWVGSLLVALAVLELVGRLRNFAMALLLVGLGFGASLALLNVDGFIARQNVQRALAGQDLDSAYLNTLSADAIPTLIDLYRTPEVPASLRQEIGGVLACRSAIMEAEVSSLPWQSFHLARYRAGRLLEASRGELSAIPTYQDEYGFWMVKVNGQARRCIGEFLD